MKKQPFWLATQALSLFLVASIVQFFQPVLSQENLGTEAPYVDEFIGCLHEDVCNENESCFDDGLFGKCLDEEKAESAQLRPDEFSLAQIAFIQNSLETLFKDSWSSLETQCNVRSLILSIRLDLPLSFVEEVCGLKPRPDNEETVILDEGIPFVDNNSMTFKETETISQADGESRKHESIWIKFENPLKSKAEAEEISKSIVEDLDKDSDSANADYRLSPNGKTIQIEVDTAKDQPEVLKRLTRFVEGANFNQQVDNFGVGVEKRDHLPPKSHHSSIKGIIIGASVCGAVVVLVVAVSVPLCLRRQNRLNKAGLVTDEKDDEKCLHGENTDMLGPLVNEAKKSAQNLLAGASDYFASFSKTKETTNSKHGMTKQISNGSIASSSNSSQRTNSTSSWSGEPAKMDIDISTGHLILNYLERHLKDRNRLEEDWRSVCDYEADDAVICEAATRQGNMLKNRPGAVLPYEQSRVRLRNGTEDYINASLVYDHEPRNPAYILTQTPMESTMKDFWQMVWEQSSVTIVSLDRVDSLVKPDSPRVIEDPSSPVQYWPDQGWELYGNFEIHLVSEHMWCGAEYVVRSFYLKNVETSETRTVTQFHFLSWPLGKPADVINTMLEFRRRVNKSFRGKSSPIIIHCPDGSGASGTYLLLDLVLKRIQSGIKELDIAATLEHVRDQRQGVVPNKDEFEFVLGAIAEEVNALLKAAVANTA